MGKRVFSTWKSTLLTHASPTHTKTRLPTKRKMRNISQQKTKKNKNKAFSYGARLMLWFCRNGIVIMVMLFFFFRGNAVCEEGGEEKKARWSLIHASHILRKRRKTNFFGSKVRENNARGRKIEKLPLPLLSLLPACICIVISRQTRDDFFLKKEIWERHERACRKWYFVSEWGRSSVLAFACNFLGTAG